MPVPETSSHPTTQRAADAPYGCRDRVIAPGHYVQDRRQAADGSFTVVSVFIPHVMSTECRYDRSTTDRRCSSCSLKGSGERYDAMIKARSA